MPSVFSPASDQVAESDVNSVTSASLIGNIFGLTNSTAYVRASDNRIYGLARRFIGDELWNQLRENVEIMFSPTGSDTVDKIIEINPADKRITEIDTVDVMDVETVN